MIWLARLAVLMAAGTTLFFNGSWAWHAVDAAHHRAGLVALALAIDLCKITFLGAAAWCWNANLRLRALTLLLLWPLAFSASTFMGYASLTTQTGAADAVVQGQASNRARLQAQYDRANDALIAARKAPDWTATNACTTLRTNPHRNYCANVQALQKTVDDLARQLGPAPSVTARQDLQRLAQETGIATERLAFYAALFPALLLELLASFGSYAVGSRSGSPNSSQKPSQAPVARFSWGRLSRIRRTPKNPPEGNSGALAAGPASAPPATTQSSPKLPRIPGARATP